MRHNYLGFWAALNTASEAMYAPANYIVRPEDVLGDLFMLVAGGMVANGVVGLGFMQDFLVALNEADKELLVSLDIPINPSDMINIHDQILAVKQIRIASRLLAQGFSQETSSLSPLTRDVLLEIAARSAQKPETLAGLSRKIATTFFARPPSAYTDGCSPLPLALRYQKAHSDGNSPWPIICTDNSTSKFGK